MGKSSREKPTLSLPASHGSIEKKAQKRNRRQKRTAKRLLNARLFSFAH